MKTSFSISNAISYWWTGGSVCLDLFLFSRAQKMLNRLSISSHSDTCDDYRKKLRAGSRSLNVSYIRKTFLSVKRTVCFSWRSTWSLWLDLWTSYHRTNP